MKFAALAFLAAIPMASPQAQAPANLPPAVHYVPEDCYDAPYELERGVTINDRHCGPRGSDTSQWKSSITPLGTQLDTSNRGDKVVWTEYQVAGGQVRIAQFEDRAKSLDVDFNLAELGEKYMTWIHDSTLTYQLVSDTRFNYGGMSWAPTRDIVVQGKPRRPADGQAQVWYHIVGPYDGYSHFRWIADTLHKQLIILVAIGGRDDYDSARDWMNSLTIDY